MDFMKSKDMGIDDYDMTEGEEVMLIEGKDRAS
jgi:hypothetical protein